MWLRLHAGRDGITSCACINRWDTEIFHGEKLLCPRENPTLSLGL
jgi:hypothetical protein